MTQSLTEIGVALVIALKNSNRALGISTPTYLPVRKKLTYCGNDGWPYEHPLRQTHHATNGRIDPLGVGHQNYQLDKYHARHVKILFFQRNVHPVAKT